MLNWPAKQETQSLTYGVDWSARLGLATIATSLFTVTSGSVILSAQTHSNTVASVTVAGGVTGECAELLCHMVDSNGATYDTAINLAIRDWSELGDQASTATKRQLIEMAFEECGLPGYSFEASADEIASATRRLDALMATNQIAGLKLGYNFPAGIGQSDPDDRSGIPDYAILAVAGQLAFLVAPGIGKTISPEARLGISKSLQDLRLKALCPKESSFAPGTPSGAGNRFPETFMAASTVVDCC